MLQINRGKTAISVGTPAPVGGLNARDPLSAMPPLDASLLTNMFCDSTGVKVRAGHEAFADGTALFNTAIADTSGFRKIMVWSSGASSKMFVALLGVTGGGVFEWKIYEVSTTGTLTLSHTITTGGTPIVAGSIISGDDIMFVSGSSTAYMIVILGDGTPAVRAFDGASWTTPSITGLNGGNRGLASHRSRLWFYGADLTAQYLPLSSIAGTLVNFNFGTIFSRGGRIVSMGTWALDGGDGGTDDLLYVQTDRGQIAFYSGYDPSSIATFQIVGVYDTGKIASGWPTSGFRYLKSRSFSSKYGADVLLLLNDGVASAAKVLRPADGQQDYTISSKINYLIRDAAATYGFEGSAPAEEWLITHHSRLRQLIVNIPTAAAADTAVGRATSIQYVMNTETGAWQKFEDMGFLDAVVWRGDLYMIAGGYYVYRYGQVGGDLGTSITFEARQAYTDLGYPDNKLFTLLQTNMSSILGASLTVQVDADYNGRTISTYTLYNSISAPLTFSAGQRGQMAAVHVKGQSNGGALVSGFVWYSSKWAAKPGGFL